MFGASVSELCIWVTVLLQYFASEKPLRMSQINKNIDPLQSYYCVLARIVCIYCGFIVANCSTIAKFTNI